MLTYLDEALLSQLQRDAEQSGAQAQIAAALLSEMVERCAADERRRPAAWATAEQNRLSEWLRTLHQSPTIRRAKAAKTVRGRRALARRLYLKQLFAGLAAREGEVSAPQAISSLPPSRTRRPALPRTSALAWLSVTAFALMLGAAYTGELMLAAAPIAWAVVHLAVVTCARRRADARTADSEPDAQLPAVERFRRSARHAPSRPSPTELHYTQYAMVCDEPDSVSTRVAVVQFRAEAPDRYRTVTVPGWERRFNGEQLEHAAAFRADCEAQAALLEARSADRYAAFEQTLQTCKSRQRQLAQAYDDQAALTRQLTSALDGHPGKLV